MFTGKVEEARLEYRQWCDAIGIDNLEKLNTVLKDGRGVEFINLCEARQERKYAEIANGIWADRQQKKIVMISGPSSSGKTSSSLRIAQQCRVLGLNPKVVELDNYFVNRVDTPLDGDGNYDYESIYAMDMDLLNSQINDMLAGREVELPKYNFITGEKEFGQHRMKLVQGDILMMEGIHALNPQLTSAVDRDCIQHIYISALSALMVTDTDHGSTTDKRLLRRMVRDFRTRGQSPEDTILRWPSVRRGEIKWIFPYEENAEMVFNSSMLYDLPLLKYFAMPLLEGVAESSPAYSKAAKLIELLNRIQALTPSEIAAVPPTSIMREFIGGQRL
ncbi:MAG: nucleoside kinase [Bacteroidales bacterium]|nr:nucleoside kinase [Bacteroidales bacterium]